MTQEVTNNMQDPMGSLKLLTSTICNFYNLVTALTLSTVASPFKVSSTLVISSLSTSISSISPLCVTASTYNITLMAEKDHTAA